MIKDNLQANTKISFGTWMVLIGVALFFDTLEALISLIPIAGEIIAIGINGFAFAIFWLIFKMNGETYSKKTVLTGFIIGFIPFVNMLPECTLTIVKLYFDAKMKKKVLAAGSVTKVSNMVKGLK